jgi:DNA helicase-2/ATP-dependent DNA helicase PcrA
MHEQRRERLRKVEALFQRAGTQGEPMAAAAAMSRMRGARAPDSSAPEEAIAFAVGHRVFHAKFGSGRVVHVDGNKLTIAFDNVGEKRIVDSFVERL